MAKRKLRVAVVGDFMKDIYHIGEAVGLSAEVPIPVVKVRKTLCFPGGAGNVARNLGELGVETLWFGGGGEPVKHRLMVGDHQIARWDENDVCTPVMGLERLREVDAIVVADYGKGSIDKYTIEAIRKTQGIPVFVDQGGREVGGVKERERPKVHATAASGAGVEGYWSQGNW